jgi:hypothetical protein
MNKEEVLHLSAIIKKLEQQIVMLQRRVTVLEQQNTQPGYFQSNFPPDFPPKFPPEFC